MGHLVRFRDGKESRQLRKCQLRAIGTKLGLIGVVFIGPRSEDTVYTHVPSSSTEQLVEDRQRDPVPRPDLLCLSETAGSEVGFREHLKRIAVLDFGQLCDAPLKFAEAGKVVKESRLKKIRRLCMFRSCLRTRIYHGH